MNEQSQNKEINNSSIPLPQIYYHLICLYKNSLRNTAFRKKKTASMTSLHIHYSVPSTILDKNVSSLQQTHSFSLGIATHRSHEHQDVFDRRFSFPSFETESSSSPSSSSAALCGCSSLEEYSGSNWYGEICDMFTINKAGIRSADCSEQPRYVISPQCFARYSRWRPQEFRSGWKAVLWKLKRKSVR